MKLLATVPLYPLCDSTTLNLPLITFESGLYEPVSLSSPWSFCRKSIFSSQLTRFLLRVIENFCLFSELSVPDL